jgi:mono/diheme cytochrome c family protein
MIFLFPLLFLLLSCGSEKEKEEPVSPTLSDIQEKIFNRSCIASSCHGGSDGIQRNGLDLRPGESEKNLILVSPKNPSALAKGYKRVYPSAPTMSFLYIKITNPKKEEGEGDRMPPLGEGLSPQKIEAVRKWIESLPPP